MTAISNDFDTRHLAPLVRELSVLNHWRSAWAIVFQWGTIALAAAAALTAHHPAVYIVAAIVIATRQHALGILVHEAAHFRLFRSRRTNDLIGDLALGFPIGVATQLYRATHLRHHAHLNTEHDPDHALMRASKEWTWPKTLAAALRLFASDLLLLNRGIAEATAQWLPWTALFRRRPLKPGHAILGTGTRLLVVAWTSVITLSLIASGYWWQFALLWLLPLLLITPILFRVRALGEHVGTENTSPLNASRNVVAGMLERFFFAPLNTNYHLTHHLFPSVPFYNLPLLQKHLDQMSGFAEAADIKNGYLVPIGRGPTNMQHLLFSKTPQTCA